MIGETKVYWASCEMCLRSGPTFSSWLSAAAFARQTGWLLVKEHGTTLVYCPDHRDDPQAELAQRLDRAYGALAELEEACHGADGGIQGMVVPANTSGALSTFHVMQIVATAFPPQEKP